MAIFLDGDSKLVVQGMTGSEGMKHTTLMLAAGVPTTDTDAPPSTTEGGIRANGDADTDARDGVLTVDDLAWGDWLLTGSST